MVPRSLTVGKEADVDAFVLKKRLPKIVKSFQIQSLAHDRSKSVSAVSLSCFAQVVVFRFCSPMVLNRLIFDRVLVGNGAGDDASPSKALSLPKHCPVGQ